MSFLGAEIETQKSRIELQKSTIELQKSEIEQQKSTIERQKSTIQRHKSENETLGNPIMRLVIMTAYQFFFQVFASIFQMVSPAVAIFFYEILKK